MFEQLDQARLIVQHLFVRHKPIFMPTLQAYVIPMGGQASRHRVKEGEAIAEHPNWAGLVLHANPEHHVSRLKQARPAHLQLT